MMLRQDVKDWERFYCMSKEYMEIFEESPEVRGFFSLKYGAVKGSPYNNINIFKELGLDKTVLVWPGQVHKTHVAVIDEKMVKYAKLRQRLPEMKSVVIPQTDGVVTNLKNVLLTTVHADCLPLYFWDYRSKAIGLVHAGWRGTAAGIGQKTVGKMTETYGSHPEDIQVYIGPGISQCCFETGSEVYEEFKSKWNFTDDYVIKKDNKYYIDIKAVNRKQLELSGVRRENIGVSSRCTCCERDLFCSYRREGGTYMRMGAGLCMVC